MSNSSSPSKQNKKYNIPTILYEQPSGRNGDTGIPFPYIEVKKEEEMPPVLFIFEYKETGETEPDEMGRECAIVDQTLRKYVNLDFLQESLPAEINDLVRVALGMKPLEEAKVEGQKILDRVFGNAAPIEKSAKSQKEEIKKEVKVKFEEKMMKGNN